MNRTLATLFLGFLSSVGSQFCHAKSGDTLFANATVFDGEQRIDRANVLVSDGLILAIGEDAVASEECEVIDCTGKTLLPGYIDSHTHAFFESQLQQALRFGVTTEMDMMGEVATAATLREGRDDPLRSTDRADYFSAGAAVTVKGGHGTQFGFPVPTLESSDQATGFVRDRAREGSDYIKLILEDGSAFGMSRPTLTPEMFAAAVSAAKHYDKLAVSHIGSAKGADVAVSSGINGLVHLFAESKITNEAIKRFVDAEIFVVPTAAVISNVAGRNTAEQLLSQTSIAEMLTVANRSNLAAKFPVASVGANSWENLRFNIRALHTAGVPILAGTDAPNPGTVHGASLHHEMWLLVEAGLTPSEALSAATSAPAKQFQLKSRGRIKKSMRADLQLVNGDPTKDITNTANILGVWKNGRRVDLKTRRDLVAMESQVEANAASQSTRQISDFENGKVLADFGAGWMPSTDAMMGGTSSAKSSVVQGGANQTQHAVKVSGNVQDKQPAFSGMMFAPGDIPMQPKDISDYKTLRFWAKGNDTDYRVMLFFQKRGFNPSVKTFKAAKNWTEYRFPISAFDKCDGTDVLGVWFGSEKAGAFEFEIDELALEK